MVYEPEAGMPPVSQTQACEHLIVLIQCSFTVCLYLLCLTVGGAPVCEVEMVRRHL